VIDPRGRLMCMRLALGFASVTNLA
jgi:hypothetical protein